MLIKLSSADELPETIGVLLPSVIAVVVDATSVLSTVVQL